jgi:hypothetical protein
VGQQAAHDEVPPEDARNKHTIDGRASKALFDEVPTIRINNKYTQPEMATDMLEADLEKLNLLWQRGRDSAREVEANLRTFLM